VPRYYIFYDPKKRAVRTSSRKPSSYPHVYVFQGGITIFFTPKIKATARDIDEACYFLLAHELNSEDEQRQQAFRALRERLEAMKTLQEVKHHG